MTIFIAFLIALPGVLAALYLEEYRRESLDRPDRSVDQQSSPVPSIIFGLLALAVFINWFGLCQAARSSAG